MRCYGNLYAAARVDALDSLDNLAPLKDADELKSKILFSVVVVSRPAVTRLVAASGFCTSVLGDWLALLHPCLVFLSNCTSLLVTWHVSSVDQNRICHTPREVVRFIPVPSDRNQKVCVKPASLALAQL